MPRPLPAFFFQTEAGREPVREWLKALPKRERKMIGEDIMTVQFRWPLGMPLVDNLGPGI
ncbi:MAG: type II toxin-antitoxin system RelE/ParE family toxin [Verrucomicrobiaceae bacterium]|nr:type II toxin-antitoxin system RelE/ParE family toxin [Verrucomicrobiaceae bacterium]